ncbi:hypothetical protein ABZP36_018443 [Zizania latifolia]
MLNSTVEMTALWASSSSPSLLTFCLIHLTIALLLVAGRCSASHISGSAAGDGERTMEANESKLNCGREEEEEEDPAAAIDAGERTLEANGWKTNRGGEEDPAAGGLGSYAPGVNGHAEEFLPRVGDADAVEIPASEKCSARLEESIAADASHEKHSDDGEDDLMTRAEEFIQRMNRIWMAENLRVCL